MKVSLLALWLSLTAALGCRAAPPVFEGARNEVLVLGMIHGDHLESPKYGIAELDRIFEEIAPDFVLCEVPPDRLAPALEQFHRTGEVTEPRVARFPEYVDSLFPLSIWMRFEIVPCAAWTQAMSDDRRRKLDEWRTTRAADYEEMAAAQEWIGEELDRLGYADDPFAIHTEEYDRIVERGMEPYNRLFNDDLGPGGWDNINAAHYALIASALDRQRGAGKRFLVTFGAWHKHWFLRQLRARDDVVLLDFEDVVSRN